MFISKDAVQSVKLLLFECREFSASAAKSVLATGPNHTPTGLSHALGWPDRSSQGNQTSAQGKMCTMHHSIKGWRQATAGATWPCCSSK